MALLQKWRDKAYSETAEKSQLEKLWSDYFLKEKEIYAQLLKDPDTEVKGTVAELAQKFGVDLMTMTGILNKTRSRRWRKTPLFLCASIRKNYIRTWSLQEQTGCTDFRSGIRFLTRTSRRSSTGSRRIREPSIRRFWCARMIPVLAEAVRNIRGAMEERERKRRKKDCNVTE